MPNVRSPKGKRKITLTTITNAYLCHLLQTIQAIQLRIADGGQRLSPQQKECAFKDGGLADGFAVENL